jgi:hypothetical protein
MQNAIQEVPGADALFKWFGYWPDFHDAEVLGIDLNRSGLSRVRVHTFEMSNQVGKDGCYVCVKHVIVSFLLEDLKTVQLQAFNHQNALSELALMRTEEGFQLLLEPSYGAEGSLTAERIRIEIEPGIPLDSQYRKNST